MLEISLSYTHWLGPAHLHRVRATQLRDLFMARYFIATMHKLQSASYVYAAHEGVVNFIIKNLRLSRSPSTVVVWPMAMTPLAYTAHHALCRVKFCLFPYHTKMEMGLVSHNGFPWKVVFPVIEIQMAWALHVFGGHHLTAVCTLLENIFKSFTRIVCNYRRMMPNCLARRLVDILGFSEKYSATAAIFSIERLLRGILSHILKGERLNAALFARFVSENRGIPP